MIDKWLTAGREGVAQRVAEVLPKRFARYGLTLHPTKTRLLRYTQPGGDDDERSTFDFLGFTHYRAKAPRRDAVVLAMK